MTEIKTIQPNKLRSVDDLVTAREFDDLMNSSLTSLRGVPLIMPEANQEAIIKAGIALQVIDVSTLSEGQRRETSQKLAIPYAYTFAGEPWKEVSRCEKTGKFFPDQPGKQCACCGTTTVEAYPLNETADYIQNELSRPYARLMVVKDGDEIVGAAWGFTYANPQAFVEDKYPPESQADILAACDKVNFRGKFFYMSESFILPKTDKQGELLYRGKGILNAFYGMFVSAGQELGLPMLGRTTADSGPVNRALLNFGFELILGPQIINDRREIRTMRNTYVNGIDSQNPKRVLYALGGRN